MSGKTYPLVPKGHTVFLKITDQRLWRIVFHYVEAAVARMDLADVSRVAIDETAAKRGQDYITLVVDIDGRRVVFVADGRSADTVRQFADHLEDHGGKYLLSLCKHC